MNKIRFGYYFLFVTLMIMAISIPGFATPAIAQTDQAYKVCVVDDPVVSNFPEVSLKFMALDQNLRNMTALQQANVQINEEGEVFNLSSLSRSENGVGLNLYFVIDRGNRTDPVTVKAIMARFADNFMVDGLDRVSIISSAFTEDPLMRIYGPDVSTANLSKTVTNISSRSESEPFSAIMATKAAINNIRSDAFGCSRQNIIVVITGPDALASAFDYNKVIADAQEASTRIFIVKTISRTTGNEAEFENVATSTKGLYIPLGSTFLSTSSDLDLSLFEALRNARTSYTVSYRSTNSMNGDRNLSVVVGGTETIAGSASAKYSVNLQAPVVTINNPLPNAVIVRTGQEKMDTGDVIYDVSEQAVEWRVDFPDGYTRNLVSTKIVMITSTGEEVLRVLAPEEVNKTTNHVWDMRSVISEGDNTRSLRIDVEDDLGIKASSEIVPVTITNIPPKSTTSTMIQWQLYALYGFMGLVILLFVIFFKRIKRAFSAGGAIGDAIENVRKTIVGGRGHRRNPIAKLEVLRPTIETKSIFTESVKLGRDPKVSDYTFFTLNSECSVSGEHAHLMKKRDGWVIIAVSGSKSPVFVDHQQIPFHQEVPLRDGQEVELGHEMLGSALFRFKEVAASDEKPIFELDETNTAPDDEGGIKTQVLITPGKIEGTDMGQATSVMLGELDDLDELTKDQDDFDGLFEGLRGK